VVNAIYVWGLARKYGGEVLLRIEDHDRQRSRPEYERHILDDLEWLGFLPDYFPTDSFRSGPCVSRQSDRHQVYARYAAALLEEGAVYGCLCSRRDHELLEALEKTASRPQGCPGSCDERGVAAAEGRAWRLRIPDVVESFDDLLMGPQRGPTSALGDIVVRDRRGNWTYQFAVVVDDLEQGIDLVVRGRDLLTSTGPQIYLGRRLGRPLPATFAHHLLVMKDAGQKLSKSDGDTGVRELARQGLSAADLIGRAAFRAGLAADVRPISASEVSALFP
jgi:glutamyl-tRNA synthetase/glutamyl-Q tRNA(Asp) synthetase